METWEEGRENWKCPRVGKRAIENSWGLRVSSWNFLWSWGFFLSWLSLSRTSSFPSNLVLKYLSLLGLLSYTDRFEFWVFMCARALPSFGSQVFKTRFFNPILGLWPSVSRRLESSIQLQSRPLDLLLVLDHLTGRPGITNSSAMLILIADTLHLLEGVRRRLYKHTKEHTHKHARKNMPGERIAWNQRGGDIDSRNTQKWIERQKERRTKRTEMNAEIENHKEQRDTGAHKAWGKKEKIAQERHKEYVEKRNMQDKE